MGAVLRGANVGVRVAATLLAVQLIFAAVAQASVSPTNPVVGDTITVNGPGAECPNNAAPTFNFTLAFHNSNGSTTTTASASQVGNNTFTAKVTQAGSYTATVTASCPGGNNGYTPTSTDDFTVHATLGGSIAIAPDPPIVNQTETLTGSATGGYPGYTFSWSIDGGPFSTPSTSRTTTTTFTTTGQHTVRLTITDNSGGDPSQSRTVTVTQIYTVGTPTTSTTTTTGTTSTTTTASCNRAVSFDLSQFTTTGCFTHASSNPDVYTTTSAVTFNGIYLPDYGQTFTITAPLATNPNDGGHFSAPSSAMMLDSFTAYSGDIDWALPAGHQGDEKPVKTFSVTNGSHFLGLPVLGSVALQIGVDSSGTAFADFPLNLELPASFRGGPDGPEAGTVSGAVSVRVDAKNGVQYNGLKLAAKDVWLGRLKVKSVCFSYIPSGGTSTTPCDKPSFAGDSSLAVSALNADDPFITCNTNPNTNRWDASAEIQLPTSDVQLGAFGGMANGELTSLGASVGNLGQRVPLADGVYLDHVSFGICLQPPPFKLRASIGANFLGSKNTVEVDGGLTYTDGYGANPWNLRLDGSVTVGTIPVGYGTFGINGFGVFDFALGAGVNLFNGAVSLSANVNGWIDGRSGNFVVAGDGKGCLEGVGCLGAEGEVSSVGIAGCLQIGSASTDYGVISIPLDGGSPQFGVATEPITAGFGYNWHNSTYNVLGGTCDFTPYEPTYPTSARDQATPASAGYRLRIAPGTKAVSLRIHGTHGAPRIVLHAPHGATITQPASGGALRKGHYLIVENKTDGTTNVLLLRPAAGVWTISRAAGSSSSPTKVDRSSLAMPPVFATRIRARGGLRIMRVAYSVPVGTTVRLLEKAKGVTHTLAAPLRGRRCPGLPKLLPGTRQRVLCTTIRFRPANGPGGVRHIEAIVTRRGIPIHQKNIGSFRLAKLTPPSKVGALRAQRGKNDLLVAFSPSRGAARYSISAKLSDGRELAFDLASGCRALRIANVPSTDSALVSIAGVRFDLVAGRRSRVYIKPGARTAGTSGRKLKLGRVCT